MKNLATLLFLLLAIPAYAQVFPPPSSSYNPGSVAITGGTINGTTVGASTPAAGTFSTLTSNGATAFNAVTDGAITIGAGGLASNYFSLSGARGFIGDVSGNSIVLQPTTGKNILFEVGGSFGSGTIGFTMDSARNVAIGNSGTVTSDPLWWDPNGEKHEAGSAPSVSGTGCSLTSGTNAVGIIATSSSTACTVTFANSGWSTWASCTVSANTSAALPYVSAMSKTAATFTEVSSTGSLYYTCGGN